MVGEIYASVFFPCELFQPRLMFQVRPEAYNDGVEDILAFFVWPLFVLLFSKIWVFFSQSTGHPERRTLAAYQPLTRRKKFNEIFTWKAWPACDKYLE